MASPVARARLAGVAAYLPPARRSSAEVEQLVRERGHWKHVPKGVVQTITGIRERRVAADGVNASDLAAAAGQRVLARTGTRPEDVDLLIFASAGQDLVEPATANIVQEKVGTSCAVFDVKNACNSFLNGLQVAESFVRAGMYRRVLVTTGEVPSRCIKWDVADREDFRLSFPGFTLGDGGGAALVEPAAEDDDSGIYHSAFTTVSRYWDVATLPGGGSMHPRGDEYTYIRGDAGALRDAFASVGPGILREALDATGTRVEDYARILVHQVSMPYLRAFLEATDLPEEKVVLTLPLLGNMAAASLPVAFALAEESGEIKRGDRVMWLGLAGGISIGVLLMRY